MSGLSASTRLDADPSKSLPEIDVREAEQQVSESRELGWLEKARNEIGSVSAAYNSQKIVSTVNTLVNLANDAIDAVKFDVSANDAMALCSARERDRNWSDLPIIAARKAERHANINSPLLLPNLQAIYSSELELGAPRQLVALKNRASIEKIGTINEFLAKLFWAEIQSIHNRQTQWDNSSLFDASVVIAHPTKVRTLTALREAVGHQIHSVKAKDTTGRWAQYFVYVRPDREAEFIKAIEGDGIVDLEEYGSVLSSHYHKTLRDRQTSLAHAKLTAIVNRYIELAQRERTYSYKSERAALEDFKARRFSSAVKSSDSRDALVEELVSFAKHRDWFESPEVVNKPRKVKFRHRLNAQSSKRFIEMALAQSLPLSEWGHAFTLLDQPNDHLLSALRARIAVASEVAASDGGTIASAVEAVEQLSSEGLAISANAIDGFARDTPGTAVAGAGAGTAPSQDIHVAIRTNSRSALPYESSVRGTLTLLAMLWRYAECSHGDLSDLLKSTKSDQFIDIKQFLKTTEPHLLPTIGHPSETDMFDYGMRVQNNIIERISYFYTLSYTKNYVKLLERLINEGFIDHAASLCFIGRYIESKPYNERYNLVMTIISRGLEEAFDAADYPGDRENFVRDLTDALLAHTQEVPKNAPELYLGLRGPEAPPEFVSRVYGHFIGKGLTRSHLRRLDPGLYQAISNWTRKNEWPSDVHLPTLKEENDRWVERIEQEGIEGLSVREGRRFDSARKRRGGFGQPD